MPYFLWYYWWQSPWHLNPGLPMSSLHFTFKLACKGENQILRILRWNWTPVIIADQISLTFLTIHPLTKFSGILSTTPRCFPGRMFSKKTVPFGRILMRTAMCLCGAVGSWIIGERGLWMKWNNQIICDFSYICYGLWIITCHWNYFAIKRISCFTICI